MNYTYYNKLKSINLNNRKKLHKYINDEIFLLNHKTKNSIWGKTKAQQKYINLLKIIKVLNYFYLKFIIRMMIKILDISFNKRIRVLFAVNEYSVFPSVDSLYNDMKKNNNFICDLVHIPFTHENKNNSNNEIDYYKKMGYSEIVEYNEYNLKEKSPDIIIYLKPYDLIPEEYYIDQIETVIDYVMYIPYGLHAVDSDIIIKYSFQLPIEDKAWCNISYSNYNQKLAEKYSKNKGKNFALVGHPRMDLIHSDYSDSEDYKEIKKRANGRKIFLYDPHHVIKEEYKWGTFKLYGLDIFEYFKKNKDVFLLYRPHPLLKESLKKEYKENSDFFKRYNKYLKEENIYYDSSDNYLISMHISDFLIADANTFVPEFTLYNKPVIYIKYKGNTLIKDKELLSMIYSANSIDEIIKHINKLKNGKDKLKKIRDKKIKTHFFYDESEKVSIKIMNMILKEFKGI